MQTGFSKRYDTNKVSHDLQGKYDSDERAKMFISHIFNTPLQLWHSVDRYLLFSPLNVMYLFDSHSNILAYVAWYQWLLLRLSMAFVASFYGVFSFCSMMPIVARYMMILL
jgi:hypothetical protein